MSQKIKTSVEIDGSLTASQIANATTDTDKFLVSDGGTVKYRTGAELASDLGIASGSTSKVQHQVKAGVAINKGQAVYVTSADGTNMIVGLASNASEATSSKTMGLLNATVGANGFADVITEGLLDGLNTSAATVGDPVWLGTGGNLIYGLANKPYAPNHLVFIGIVTRVNANNGEIFVKVQNGFELDEIHDVDLKTTTKVNGHLLGYNGSLWVNKTIAEWLGYTPYNASNPAGYISSYTETDTLASVTARGATTGTSITVGGVFTTKGTNPYIQWQNSAGTRLGYIQHATNLVMSSDTGNIEFTPNSNLAKVIGNFEITGTLSASGYNKTNWDTAYGWGNHASAGYAASGHTHGLGRHNLAAPALIDSLTTSNFRSTFFGTSANDYQISTARFNSVPAPFSGLNMYGTAFAWSGADTHGFLAVDYIGPAAIIGGGNGQSINWTKRLAFLDDTVPNNRTITINGTSYDLSANRSWTVTASETDTLATVTARGASTSTLSTFDGGLNIGSTKLRWGGATTPTLGLPFSGSANAFWIDVNDGDTGGLMVDNEGVTVYGAGDNGYVFRVIDEDVYQATSNVTNSTTFQVSQGQNGGGYLRGVFNVTDYLIADNSARSPIFYDSNNTGYYGDFASTSRQYQAISFGDSTRYSAINTTINGAGAGDKLILYGDTSNYDARLLVGADYDMLFKSQGNAAGRGSFKFYSGLNSSLALTIDGTQGLRAGTSYNNSPAGTYFSHTLSGVGTNRVVNFDGNGTTPSVWWTNGTRAYAAIDAKDPGMNFWANNGSSWQQQMEVNYGNVTINTDIRSPIFYDSNNTGYYLDPASTSNLNAVNVSAINSRGTSQIMYYEGFTLDANTMSSNSTGFSYQVNSPFYGPIARFSAGGGYDMWIASPYIGGNGFAFRTRNGDNATINAWKYPAVYGSVNSGGALYATTYYDQDNSGYYVDPASTSSLNVLSMANKIIVGSFPNSTVNNGEAWIGRAADRSAGTMTVQLGGNLDRKFEVVDYGWTTVNFSVNGYGAAEASGSMRAPIFYDSNDTSYYLDPNSTSRLLAVNAPSGFTSVGNPWGTANSAYFPNGITTAGSDNWIYGHTYVGNAPANGAGHEFWSTGKEYHRSNEATNGHGASGRWLSIQSANGNFIPYSFESEYGNHSWGTVARFRINQSGADRPSIQFSNASNDTRWNIGYCYADDNFRIVQNMGYRNDNSTSDGWGTQRLLLDTAGNFYSDGLYQSNASLRSPIYYDSNNTGYYIDAASTSNLNDTVHKIIRFAGVGGDSGNGSNPDGYAIYQQGGSWSYPYPDLCIGYHTGIKIGAHYSYNGTRFYNNSDWATITASVNDGDNNFRGYYDVIAYASDRRLKHKVKPIDNALSKVKSLTGMTYQWNEIGKEHGWDPDTEVREAGVFAQDVQAVLPEAVRLAPFDDDHGVSRSGESFLTVKYDKIVPLLIEAIKEQQTQIEELKELVNKLINK